MSEELGSDKLREMYFDAVRREAAIPGKFTSELAILMARKLCEADGHNPDKMVFGDIYARFI